MRQLAMTCVTDVEGLGDRKWTSLRDCAFGLLLACTQNMGKGRGTGGTGLALAPFRRLSPVTDDCASIRRPIGWGMQGTAAWEPPLPPVPPAFAVPGVPQAAQCPQYPYPPNPPCTPSNHTTPNTHRPPPAAASPRLPQRPSVAATPRPSKAGLPPGSAACMASPELGCCAAWARGP